jgi:hypothetical protein
MVIDNIYLKFLLDNNQEGIKFLSKVIAIAVRNNMEDFHVDHLSDDQMKELNPLIRNGIYNALFAISNLNKKSYCKEWLGFHLRCIPEYWEDPELEDGLDDLLKETFSKNEISFKSSFLNEQLKLCNIFHNSVTGCIEIKPSFKFEGIAGVNTHYHRDRISAQLRKEKYKYIPSLSGYVKGYFI